MVYLVTGILGAIIGSFLNVCIYRIPRGESIIRPRSRCPHCQVTIPFYDNLPILSFFILRGHCRQCRVPISWRYPLVETINTGGYIFLLLKFGLGWQLLVYALLFSVLVVVTFIDLSHRIIPDVITFPGIVLGVLLAGVGVLPSGFWNSILGLLLGGGFLLLTQVIMRFWMRTVNYRRQHSGQPMFYTNEEVELGGMGGGDIKMMAMVGAFLGWKGVFLTIFLGALVGSIVGLYLMFVGGKDRKYAVPFGPFLALGAVISLVWGPEILVWYSQLGSY